MHPYAPDNLPLAPSSLDYAALLPWVGKARAALAHYDGRLQGIPNPEVMLSPLTRQEAVLSSRIEGTQATMYEVLEQESGLIKTGEKHADIIEIVNYRRALLDGHDYLKGYPIRINFVCSLHRTLLDSARGKNKNPGEIRKEQNHIGMPGTPIQQATFVPPNPMQLPDYMQDWERYLGSDDIDPLLQAAVLHAQFELLHPFMDGNGRIGRILIPLFLYQKKVLSQPMFYLSEYLESHRDEYYARLQAISAESDWNGWIIFFLQAVSAQAFKNSQRVSDIQALYDEMKLAIHAATHSQYIIHVLDAIFSRPIFRSTDLAKALFKKFDIHTQTTRSLLNKMKDADILLELVPGSGKRAARLCFPRLINLVEGRDIF